MESLFNFAKSRLRERTSFPRSNTIGLSPTSKQCNAANKPAGPAPIMATDCSLETSLGLNDAIFQ